MFRLPFLTGIVAVLLVAIYSVTGSRVEYLQEELSRIHVRHDIGHRIAILLAEACAKERPADPTCISQGRAASLYILGFRGKDATEPDALALVDTFRRRPQTLTDLPAYPEFALGWRKEGRDLRALAASEQVLLGREFTLARGFWALWEHAGTWHLILGLINLLLFGTLVEWLGGKITWTMSFFGGGIFANWVFATRFHHDLAVTLGASPGVYALMGTYLVFLARAILARERWTGRRTVLFVGAAVYVACDLGVQLLYFSARDSVLPLHLTGFVAGVVVAGLALSYRELRA